jgi:dephospho-CoA kinase
LTGGIGSGKSTVSALLVARGAVLVDADAITRELQAPNAPLLATIAERFGSEVISDDGSLDRAALAGVVFRDAAALADLNAIVHPAVGAEIAARVAALEETDAVVVLDIPLLVEGVLARRASKPARADEVLRYGGHQLSGLLVVDVDPELAVRRLVEHRGMPEADARARMARQAARADRLALADRVIDNGGPMEALVPQVDDAWAWACGLSPSTRVPPSDRAPD